jgi:hypothetical protein
MPTIEISPLTVRRLFVFLLRIGATVCDCKWTIGACKDAGSLLSVVTFIALRGLEFVGSSQIIGLTIKSMFGHII